MKLTIVYDNTVLKDGLREGWGFSCLIEAGENILFDTGWKGSDLLHNMRALGKDISEVDAVVLSHDHWDHTGGLTCVLNNADVRVYAPKSFSDHLKGEIGRHAELVEVGGPVKVSDNAYSTGELAGEYKGVIMEQSLALETKEGVVALTGCSHSGVGQILEAARERGRLYGLVGGLHGFDDYRALDGLKLIVPTHCTQHRLEIREKHPNATEEGGVGWTKEL